ncbi:MAG: tetraacyldisaccharide 4'-kinase [Desulfamplus sp.]|nr:tetraacyldisaccharide 4'-kinase [Desulfamplus sp.]
MAENLFLMEKGQLKRYYLLSQIKKWLIKILDRLIKISDEDFSVNQPFYLKITKYFLFVLSTIYGAVVSLRLWLYEKDIFKRKKVPCFVISIGNIIAGGSGKTPMAIYMAELLKSMGFNPVVISRGYGGDLNKREVKTDDSNMAIAGSAISVVVGDGINLFELPEAVGDEPFMMASRLSFAVIVGKDRFEAAMMALNRLKNIDVIILDDGFQHIQLKRDLDIVLMDYNRPFGNGHLLPVGRLRESPKRALERADVVIFTRYPDDDLKNFDISHLKKVANCQGKVKKSFVTKHRPFLHSFISQNRASSIKIESLKGRKGCLFSAIADNLSFRKTAQNLGISVKAHLEFNDHHMYKSGEILRIVETYRKTGANLMVTTEKDWARLGCATFQFLNNLWSMDLAVIGIEIDFLNSSDDFKEFISNLLLNK